MVECHNRLPATLWLFFSIALVGQLFAQDVLVELKEIYPEEIRYAGFTLSSEQELDVEAIGPHRRGRYGMYASAWILRSDDREVVWELSDANSKWKSRYLRSYSDKVTLSPGTYEVYYSNYPGYRYHYNDGHFSFSKLFFGDRDRDDDIDYDVFEEFQLVVKGKGRNLDKSQVAELQEKLRDEAVISLNVRRDDKFVNQGFRLKKETDLIVYAIGEARDDGAFDYGWIMDTKTREKVWQFRNRRSEHAGGSDKNRFFKRTISLPAGEYVAYYVTDDSHSPREWNAAPPYDPAFWGLSVFTENDNDARNVALFDYEDRPMENVIVELTEMRDSDFASKGFTLKRDMKVRISALGEGTDGDMYDYGWIVNTKTRERVWEMRYRRTEHAGGSSKNRIADDVIELEKGDYMVHYVTDDSHSYRAWNAAAPLDGKRWGIAVIGIDPKFKKSDVAEYKEKEDKSIVARLTRVRDYENKRTQFRMKSDGEVRIYAIGEGLDGSMYDYAWIEEEDSRKVVWEMTYRKTDHAGGARKNRVFDDTVFLRKGKYVLHYESDDSHSFGEWNASPPRDPQYWGVTLFALE